jgi:hypothetical protein
MPRLQPDIGDNNRPLGEFCASAGKRDGIPPQDAILPHTNAPQLAGDPHRAVLLVQAVEFAKPPLPSGQ